MGLRLREGFCGRMFGHWWGPTRTGGWTGSGYIYWQRCRLCGMRRPV